MTDPAGDATDDLTSALRRELAGAAVPHDASRADAMIGAASAADLLPARSWQAPLAAAAAVVVIGGGAATFAAVHGGGGAPAGGGPGACSSASLSPTTPSLPVSPSTSAAPATSTPASTTSSPTAGLDSGSRSYEPPAPLTTGTITTPAVPTDPASTVVGSGVSLPAPRRTTTLTVRPVAPTSATGATPVPSNTDDPCVADSATPSSTEPPGSATPSAGSPLTPSAGAPGTTGELPSAGVGTPSTPEPSASTVAASVVTHVSAYPGATVTRGVPFGVEGEPSMVTSVGFGRTPGMSGSITVLRGTRTTTVSDTLGSEGDTVDPPQPFVFTPQAPLRLTLTCTGTTLCSVQVTVTYQLPVTVTRP